MKVLLTFTGFHDPYTRGLVGEEEQPGPILSLVRERSFDRTILFSTPSTVEHTLATKEALKALHLPISVEIRDFPLDDPTDYIAILKGLRSHLQAICDKITHAQFSLLWHLEPHKCTHAGSYGPPAVRFPHISCMSDHFALLARTDHWSPKSTSHLLISRVYGQLLERLRYPIRPPTG